ncbi:MAG: hypothetical protein AAGH99_11105 [Planctomycetota bacterium]
MVDTNGVGEVLINEFSRDEQGDVFGRSLILAGPQGQREIVRTGSSTPFGEIVELRNLGGPEGLGNYALNDLGQVTLPNTTVRDGMGAEVTRFLVTDGSNFQVIPRSGTSAQNESFTLASTPGTNLINNRGDVIFNSDLSSSPFGSLFTVVQSPAGASPLGVVVQPGISAPDGGADIVRNASVEGFNDAGDSLIRLELVDRLDFISTRRSSLVVSRDGVIQPVVLPGTEIPGSAGLTVGEPVAAQLGDDGAVTFLAPSINPSQPSSPSPFVSLYRSDREGITALTPGDSFRFGLPGSAFTDPIAFNGNGTLVKGRNVFFNPSFDYFRKGESVSIPLASWDDPEFDRGLTIIRSLDLLLNEQDQFAFLAFQPLDDRASTSDGTLLRVLLGYDPDLGPIRLISEGDELLGSTITELSLDGSLLAADIGPEQALVDNGQLLFRFELANGQSGIGAVTIPEPAASGVLLALIYFGATRRTRNQVVTR